MKKHDTLLLVLVIDFKHVSNIVLIHQTLSFFRSMVCFKMHCFRYETDQKLSDTQKKNVQLFCYEKYQIVTKYILSLLDS